MRKWIAVVVSVVAAFVLAGCGSEDESGAGDPGDSDSQSSGPVEVGESVTVEHPGGKTATVTVLTAEWKTTAGPDAPVQIAPDNGAYLVLDVEWSGEGPYNPNYVTFTSDAGEEYNHASGALSGYEPQLESGDLTGGEVHALLVFDAPQGAGTVTVIDRRHQEDGSWTIPG